jgi:hypothetical protein
MDYNDINIISLGGSGGCPLAYVLRELNQPTYPYNWLITTQSFVIDSFFDESKFFSFESKYVYNKTYLLDRNKKAIMLHDFKDFKKQSDGVIDKYKRRFDRVRTSLNDDKEVLFVRLVDDVNGRTDTTGFYDKIFIRDDEDVKKWEEFMNRINETYEKQMSLLLISSDDTISTEHPNISIAYVNVKEEKQIKDVILKHIKYE